MANSKQLTLFKCCSRETANNQRNITRTKQARSNTTSSSSSSTTTIINADACSVAFSSCANDSSQDCMQLSVQHSDTEGLVKDDNAGKDDNDVIDAS